MSLVDGCPPVAGTLWGVATVGTESAALVEETVDPIGFYRVLALRPGAVPSLVSATDAVGVAAATPHGLLVARRPLVPAASPTVVVQAVIPSSLTAILAWTFIRFEIDFGVAVAA